MLDALTGGIVIVGDVRGPTGSARIESRIAPLRVVVVWSVDNSRVELRRIGDWRGSQSLADRAAGDTTPFGSSTARAPLWSLASTTRTDPGATDASATTGNQFLADLLCAQVVGLRTTRQARGSSLLPTDPVVNPWSSTPLTPLPQAR